MSPVVVVQTSVFQRLHDLSVWYSFPFVKRPLCTLYVTTICCVVRTCQKMIDQAIKQYLWVTPCCLGEFDKHALLNWPQLWGFGCHGHFSSDASRWARCVGSGRRQRVVQARTQSSAVSRPIRCPTDT